MSSETVTTSPAVAREAATEHPRVPTGGRGRGGSPPRTTSQRDADRRRRVRSRLIVAAVAYLLVFLVILPILWITLLSFQPSEQILSDPLSFRNLTLDNYREAIATLPLLQMYRNTIFIAAVSVALGTVVSFMVSFALTRMIFRRRGMQTTLLFYLLAGLAVPVYVLLFPVYRLDLALGIFGTYVGVILPYAAVSIPFNTLLLTGFLRSMPGELEEAAIIDGAGLFRLCWSVVVPVMRPVLATIVIFNVVYVFNEFPFVSILINDASMETVSLAVSKFQGQYSVNYGGMMAAATLVLLPQLAIYAVLQRHVIAGLTAGAVKG